MFVDDHTRLTWVYLMNDNSEVETIFKSLFKMVKINFKKQLRFSVVIKAEIFFINIYHFFMEKEIVHQSSCVDIPQQNGVAEQKSKPLLEAARALLHRNMVPNHSLFG